MSQPSPNIRPLIAELLAAIDRTGSTDAEFARSIQLNPLQISQIRTGRNLNPMLSTLERIAAGLGRRISLVKNDDASGR